MKPRSPVKWLAAAGVVAGLALPSVGTFYALRIQYPDDSLIFSLAITSWVLVGAAGLLCLIGIGLWATGLWTGRRERARAWAADGESLRGTIGYLTAIAAREKDTFVAMEAEEQKWRDENPGKMSRYFENSQRLLKQSEMIEAFEKLAGAKKRYLQIAPRALRREALREWS